MQVTVARVSIVEALPAAIAPQTLVAFRRDGVRRCRSRTQSPKSPAPQVMDAPVLGEEDELMERRTLNQITNRTRRGDLVFYYHSKGVSSRRVNQEPGARRLAAALGCHCMTICRAAAPAK